MIDHDKLSEALRDEEGAKREYWGFVASVVGFSLTAVAVVSFVVLLFT